MKPVFFVSLVCCTICSRWPSLGITIDLVESRNEIKSIRNVFSQPPAAGDFCFHSDNKLEDIVPHTADSDHTQGYWNKTFCLWWWLQLHGNVILWFDNLYLFASQQCKNSYFCVLIKMKTSVAKMCAWVNILQMWGRTGFPQDRSPFGNYFSLFHEMNLQDHHDKVVNDRDRGNNEMISMAGPKRHPAPRIAFRSSLRMWRILPHLTNSHTLQLDFMFTILWPRTW